MDLSESQLRAGKVWSGPFSSSSQSVGWASWMATRPRQSRRPLIMGTGIVPPAPLISKESLSHLQIQICPPSRERRGHMEEQQRDRYLEPPAMG